MSWTRWMPKIATDTHDVSSHSFIRNQNKQKCFNVIFVFHFILGIGGLVLACGFAAYKFKHRGQMSTSVFLMQTRVAAQGTVVSALTLGLLYSMFQKHVLHKDDWDEKK